MTFSLALLWPFLITAYQSSHETHVPGYRVQGRNTLGAVIGRTCLAEHKQDVPLRLPAEPGQVLRALAIGVHPRPIGAGADEADCAPGVAGLEREV